jgi:hypothetical protein
MADKFWLRELLLQTSVTKWRWIRTLQSIICVAYLILRPLQTLSSCIVACFEKEYEYTVLAKFIIDEVEVLFLST